MQAKCAMEISIIVVRSMRTVKQKGTFLLVDPDPQGNKLRLLGFESILRPFLKGRKDLAGIGLEVLNCFVLVLIIISSSLLALQ